MEDTSQLYFHSLYIDSISKTDTQGLIQIGVDVGQSTTPVLCKIDTGAEGNVIPVNTYKQLHPQSACRPDGFFGLLLWPLRTQPPQPLVVILYSTMALASFAYHMAVTPNRIHSTS